MFSIQEQGSVERVSAGITLGYITFRNGSSEQIIPHSVFNLDGKRIYAMITTCNSADGIIAPEAQIFNHPDGIHIFLHDDGGPYTVKQSAGYFLIFFHEV